MRRKRELPESNSFTELGIYQVEQKRVTGAPFQSYLDRYIRQERSQRQSSEYFQHTPERPIYKTPSKPVENRRVLLQQTKESAEYPYGDDEVEMRPAYFSHRKRNALFFSSALE